MAEPAPEHTPLDPTRVDRALRHVIARLDYDGEQIAQWAKDEVR
jgi:hypothetical protein